MPFSVNCPEHDKSYCGTDNLIAENCSKYSNLPQLCPYMCGVCKEKGKTSNQLVQIKVNGENYKNHVNLENEV